MNTIALALLVLLALIVLGGGLKKVDMREVGRRMRAVLGMTALGAGAVLSLTGRIGIGIALVIAGLALLGAGAAGRIGPLRRLLEIGPLGALLSPIRRTRLATARIEIQVDGRGRVVAGRVLAGRFAGADLDGLSFNDFSALMAEVAGDAESRGLLEAYLDSRHPRWREHLKQDAATGARRPARPGAMTDQEAYEVLGLQPGAGEADIREAHRRLMKAVHPDRGGSTFLAAKINEAKDRLVGRHL